MVEEISPSDGCSATVREVRQGAVQPGHEGLKHPTSRRNRARAPGPEQEPEECCYRRMVDGSVLFSGCHGVRPGESACVDARGSGSLFVVVARGRGGRARGDSAQGVDVVQRFGTDVPHGRKGLPENGSPGRVAMSAPRSSMTVSMPWRSNTRVMSSTWARRPGEGQLDNVRELPRIEVPPESAGRGGIRPCRNQGDNARPDGRVVVLPALQRGIDNDGPDVVPTAADFGRGVCAV